MYAIVQIAGHQFKVSKNETISAPSLEGEVGSNVEFDQVLLLADGAEVKVGRPYVEGAKVQAKIVEHGKDDKVLIFKKKRRKGYKLFRGHRQHLTQLQIEEIIA